MSKTFRRAAMSSICMLIVAVMSLTGATYAWFTTGTEATVENITMDVMAAEGGIQISVDGEKWANIISDVEINADEVAPVSTVDCSKFFTAVISQTNNDKIATKESVATNYIVKRFYLKNDSEAAFIADLGDTKIEPQDGNVRLGHYATRLGVRKSTAKAAYDADKATITALAPDALAFIYEPYATSHVNTNVTGSQPTYGVNTATYTGDTPAEENYFSMSTLDSTQLTNVTTNVTTTECTIEVPGRSIIAVDVFVWLEGQDVDCVNDVALSAFDITLNFKKHETTPAQGN